MSDALDGMLNVIPVVVTGGVAMKMADKFFDPPKAQKRFVSSKSKRKNTNYVKKARRLLGS